MNGKEGEPRRVFWRTKQRSSRLRSTGYHFLSTSSSSYGAELVGGMQPSNTDSGVRSCVTKSDDLSSMYTSAGDVHFSGDDAGRIQDASLYEIRTETHKEKKKKKSPHLRR